MAFPAATTLALILCFLCRAGVAVAAVFDPSSPDAVSGSSSLSLDGGLSANSSSSSSSLSDTTNASADSVSSATTPPPAVVTTTVSPVTRAASAGITQSSAVSTSGVSGTSSGSSSVPYDFKSMDNPYFVSFLEDFAAQSGQRLQDVHAVALVDPQIDLLWDVYAQTFAGGATLPAIGGGGSTSSGTSGGGSTITQYSGGGQQSAAPAEPTISNNWFQSFFKDPSQTSATSQSSSSYQQPAPTSSPHGSSSGSAMDQRLSSFFRSPSPSQQYQQQQRGVNFAQGFLNMMTRGLMPNSQQYSSQSGTSVRSGQAGTLPDSGWNTGQRATRQDHLSNVTKEQLTNELLMLLGKLPSPAPTPTSSSSSSSTSSSSQQAQPPPPQPTPPQPTPPQPTPAPTPPSAAVTQAPTQSQTQPPIFNSQIKNAQTGNPMQSGQVSVRSQSGLPISNALSAMMNFGSQTSPIGLTGLPQPQPTQQPFFDPLSAKMNMLRPIARLYNARYHAKASRDLGCRTPGEVLDMDVPRAMDLTCRRSCATIMPGAFSGKRFFLTCLCCPPYVSDHAIGMRSMYRRAEALT